MNDLEEERSVWAHFNEEGWEGSRRDGREERKLPSLGQEKGRWAGGVSPPFRGEGVRVRARFCSFPPQTFDTISISFSGGSFIAFLNLTQCETLHFPRWFEI